MQNYILSIEGMGCENCVRAVTSALTEIGAHIADVRVGMAEVAYGGEEAALREAVEGVGFDVVGITLS